MKYRKLSYQNTSIQRTESVDEQIHTETATSLDDKLNTETVDLSFSNFAKQSLTIALPGTLFFICYAGMGVLNLIFIGQKNNNDNMLKGMGISNLYLNCTLMAIVQGLLSGIDTLCSNAYSLKKYKLMGTYLNRARIIGYMATIILVTFHVFTVKDVLRLFNLNEEVLVYGCEYTYSILVYIVFDVQSMCNFRFLNVVRKSYVNFVILVAALILHPVWNYLFIIYLDMDVYGAGISYAISRLIVCVSSSIYLHFWNPVPESYFFFTRECFRGLWDFTRFSLGSMILFCAEWWAFEIQAFIAISIGEDDYAVHIILAQIASVICSISIGFSFATTILVGDYIVKTSIKNVKKAIVFSILLALASMCSVMLIVFFFKNDLIIMFIDIDTLIEKGTPIIPILCIYQLGDVMQGVLSAAMKGLRKQCTAVVLTLIQFYIIQTSMSYLFGKFLDWGVYGMWVGITIGTYCAVILYVITLISFDIKKIQIETITTLEIENIKLLMNHSSKDVFNKVDEEIGNRN